MSSFARSKFCQCQCSRLIHSFFVLMVYFTIHTHTHTYTRHGTATTYRSGIEFSIVLDTICMVRERLHSNIHTRAGHLIAFDHDVGNTYFIISIWIWCQFSLFKFIHLHNDCIWFWYCAVIDFFLVSYMCDDTYGHNYLLTLSASIPFSAPLSLSICIQYVLHPHWLKGLVYSSTLIL